MARVRLTLGEAKARVDLMISEGEIACERDNGATALPVILPTSASAFFGEFREVRLAAGDRIAIDLVGPSEFLPSFVRVGRTYDGAEVAVECSSGRVFGLETGEVGDTGMETIYHWLADRV